VAAVPQDGWVLTAPVDVIDLGQPLAASAQTGTAFRMLDMMHCGCGLPRLTASLSTVEVGSPQHFFPQTTDGQHYTWQDHDLSTPDVIDIWYDFRSQSAYANLITPHQLRAAEAALVMWEVASQGRLHFVQNTTAPARDIINIGTGDLAALGGTSGPRLTLALGGGTFTDSPVRTISTGVV